MKGFPTRKDKIILAAIDIIDEKGIQGLSTKEIALKQGISESILYKHFASLDEVLIEVLDYFSQFDGMIINTVLNQDISRREKVLEGIRSFIELYENYPALSSITLNYETLMNYEHTKEKVIMIIENRKNFIEEIIKEGQIIREFEDYYTAEELSDIIIGTFKNMIMTWRISGCNYSIKDKTLEVIKKVLDRA